MPKLKKGTILPTAEEDIEFTRQAIADGTHFTDAVLKQFKPFEQSDLPEELKQTVREEAIKRIGRPPSETCKIPISIRLSEDVVEYYRASGKGWQTRIDQTLKAEMNKR